MRITCVHCGQGFAIRVDQLGGRGYCPHCRGEIVLPSAEPAEPAPAPQAPAPPVLTGSRVVSFLVSLVLHLTLFVMLGLYMMFSPGGLGGPGDTEGEEVFIGELPSERLHADNATANLEAESASAASEAAQLEAELPRDPANDSSDALDVLLAPPSPSGGGATDFDVASLSTAGGGSMAGGGGWEGMLQNLRRNGLDIVIVFDSTGSMGGEIRQVKDQIKRIGATLVRLVPKVRISVCTYRDYTDEYVVKGLPLTGSVQDVSTFLDGVFAGGGGDYPEAVNEGLRWAVEKNVFHPAARKVILLFGDAPPHAEHRQQCLAIASDFARQQRGVVSTVTCHSGRRLAEFIEIAEAGGGEAFVSTDERQIMTQLMVLVFGSRYRGKVLEAFKLLEE